MRRKAVTKGKVGKARAGYAKRYVRKGMTHTELVNRAAKWLKNSFHCRAILTELVAYTRSGETPDAIGWVNNKSVLIECKLSKQDFCADQKKRSRLPYMPALGHWRFYLTPPNLIDPKLIPADWGLYEVHNQKIIHKGGIKYTNAGEPPFVSDRNSEVAMLVSALSRI